MLTLVTKAILLALPQMDARCSAFRGQVDQESVRIPSQCKPI
jgi:hypothetical protein